MVNYFLWLLVITLVQLSFIYLWFDSTLFSPLFQWCLRQKKDRWYTWFIFTLLTCPQCLGYWLAWGTAAVCCLLPDAPIAGMNVWRGVLVVFITGLAAAVLSRLIDGIMPEPVNQKLFVVDIKEPEQKADNIDEEAEEK